MDTPEYTVLRDTREQVGHGWIFPARSPCLGTEKATLNTGDYTLKGYEDIFIIERKGGCGEVAKNIIQQRFIKELERLESFQAAFIVFEFEMEDVITFPANSGIPKVAWPKLKITPQFFMKQLNEYNLEFKTKIIFAGSKGKEFASSLFKRVCEKWRR